MSKPKMLIIDGSSMLATNYYATIPNEVKFAKTDEEKEQYYDKILHAPDGTYTNAITGMCRMIANIVEEGDFDCIVTAFDKSRKTTFRRQMYPDYKAQRSETPEPLKSQMILIQNILADSGFPVLLDDLYEADDLAGSVAEKYKQDYQVSLLTKDRDYLQLVDDANKVTCLIMTDYEKAVAFRQRYGQSEPEEKYRQTLMEFNAAAVLGEKGVEPYQIPDLKSLEGDVSDNIPGVKGISGATAATLLRYYGSTEFLYGELERAGDDKATLDKIVSVWKSGLGLKRSPLKSLELGRESATLSKTLATIVRSIPVPDVTGYTLKPEAFQSWMNKLAIRNVSLKPGGIALDMTEGGVFHVGGRKELGIYFSPDYDPEDCGIPAEFLPDYDPAATSALDASVPNTPVSNTSASNTHPERTNSLETVEEMPSSMYNIGNTSNIAEVNDNNDNNNALSLTNEAELKELQDLIQEITTTKTLKKLNNSFERASEILIKLFDEHYTRIKKEEKK